MKLIRTLSAGALLVVTLTSCVAPAKQSEGKDANGKKIEYVYYTPIGSNVPIKVPKDQMQTSDDVTAAQDKVFSDMQRNGSAGTPQSPGGK
jgi:hypothetical protein